MIFVTLGSQKFQFNRLLQEVDALIERGIIQEEVFAQVGYSDYRPKHYPYKQFLDHGEFADMLTRADTVIAHGGTGAIIGAVKSGNKVIAVPRLAKYGEHVDNHQLQILEQFEEVGLIEPCYEVEDLAKAYQKSRTKEYTKFVSSPNAIINDISYYLEHGESENKLRVLTVGNDPSVKGGITSVISQILSHDWWPDGVEMRFIPTYIEANIVKTVFFYSCGYVKIRRCLKKWKPDVVHIHMSFHGSFIRKYFIHELCKKYGIPDIIHLHGSEFEKWYNESSPKWQARIRTVLRECGAFIVLGNEWYAAIKRIEPQTKALVVSNTISMPHGTAKWSAEPFRVLFLGVLIQRKGVADLLQAVKRLQETKRAENLQFVIAGTGSEEEALKALSQSLGVSDKVEFAGWADSEKKKELLQSSQLLVLPSYNEGLPIAILEAISYGLPVVATNVGDISAAVHDGKNGFLIEPGDVAALADAIQKAADSPERFAAMSQYSKSLAQNEFSDEKYFETLKTCYMRLGAKNGAHASGNAAGIEE